MHRVYINVVVFVRSVSVIFLNVDYIFQSMYTMCRYTRHVHVHVSFRDAVM